MSTEEDSESSIEASLEKINNNIEILTREVNRSQGRDDIPQDEGEVEVVSDEIPVHFDWTSGGYDGVGVFSIEKGGALSLKVLIEDPNDVSEMLGHIREGFAAHLDVQSIDPS